MINFLALITSAALTFSVLLNFQTLLSFSSLYSSYCQATLLKKFWNDTTFHVTDAHSRTVLNIETVLFQ